jgi:hypothetical protein
VDTADDGKASLYGCTRAKGNHVAVLLKVEGEQQLAVAIRSNNASLSKALAQELEAVAFS